MRACLQIKRIGWGAAVAALLAAGPARAALWLNEILFNPAGGDTPFEYVELRGTPNLRLPKHTCVVGVEGDAGGNPGTVQNVFDLSGERIGGNGFLLLLQKDSPFTGNPAATILINTDDGPGWGSGSSSSVGHRGENGRTDLENPSVTFFLIQAPKRPDVGEDLDVDDDGVLDGEVFAAWTVLDSVGVLDADGAGDFAYGAVNFRRATPPGNGASAPSLIIPVDFTAGYLGRAGNSIGSGLADWVASDHPAGEPPDWTVGEPRTTFPPAYAPLPLDHLGAPNFGAPPLPGVILRETDGATEVSEAGDEDTFTLALNTLPAGAVTIALDGGPQLLLSDDGGATFHSPLTVVLRDTQPREVRVRAVDDHVVDTSPHEWTIEPAVVATADPGQYPPDTLIPPVPVAIGENDRVLLSELKVNPPGPEDAPAEYVELRGAPGLRLTNVVLLVIESDAAKNPGVVNALFDLTGATLGANGLLLLAAPDTPCSPAPETARWPDARFAAPGGALDNGSVSFLLVSAPQPIEEGEDLDAGDNGVLEGLPKGSTILDGVAWSGDDDDDVPFGDAVLALKGRIPDAAVRAPDDDTPNSAAAWGFGELAGDAAETLDFDPNHLGGVLSPGTRLTPGAPNHLAPGITEGEPVSGVIGADDNPPFTFRVAETGRPVPPDAVTVHSSNPEVLPDAGLTLIAEGGGRFTLRMAPVGVGYSDLIITAADGWMTGERRVPYAASAPGRPGGRWHLGASDGSTAIALDANWMWVADDENEVLRLYPRNTSSLPIKELDFAPFLDLTDIEDGVPREVDIEASTRVGDRLFWIGSHSHANIGESRTNRARVFATDLVGRGPDSTLVYVGRYDYLKQDLVAWDHENRHGLGADYLGLADSAAEDVLPKAPDGSGWSIEGLAMMPDSDTGAYVAFRAPIVPAARRAFALIVPVLNFTELAVGNGPQGSAVFGAPVELDLYGRGIRSLKGGPDGYLIVAGPAGPAPTEYPQDFRLYTWSGDPADPPRELSADLSGLNPEGIVELPPAPWTPDRTVQIISDNGQSIFYGDGVRAKMLPVPGFKKCRSDVVRLGEPVPPLPVITAVERSETGLRVTWRVPPGADSLLQQAAQPTGPWSDAPGEATVDGPFRWQEVPLLPAAQARFFRVLQRETPPSARR
jgi:hypothetical protein